MASKPTPVPSSAVVSDDDTIPPNSVVSPQVERASRLVGSLERTVDRETKKLLDNNEALIFSYDIWTRLEAHARAQRELRREDIKFQYAHIIEPSAPGFRGVIASFPEYSLHLQVNNPSQRIDKAKLSSTLRKRGLSQNDVAKIIEESSTLTRTPQLITVSYNVDC